MAGKLLLAGLVGAVLAFTLTSPAEGQVSGYAWADDPTSANYVPSALYAHSSAGRPIRISRSGVGTYTATFEGLGGNGRAGGHVQVTAYGPGSEFCKIVNWNSGGADFIVNIRCYGAQGSPADTRFTVMVAWSDQRASGPRTHSTASLVIPQTWTADLDEGVVGAEPQADIWFEAVTATERYVTPRNGAVLAPVGTTSVGRDGCANAALTSARIPIGDLPVGSYVCVRTNEGRFSQFRVNQPVAPSPGELRIGYTTWAQ